MLKTLFSLFMVLCLCSATAGATSISAQPFEREAYKYQEMLFDSRYAELEAIAQSAIKNHTVISSGQSLIAVLHGGIEGCLSNGCKNSLNDREWERRLEHIESWLQQYPGSVTAKVARIGYVMEYAWYKRGSGYSHTVTEQGRKAYRENMELASLKLQDSIQNPTQAPTQTLAEDLRSDPRWFSIALNVALAQKWPLEKFDPIYHDGIKWHPRFTPLYFAKAAYLAPRWHGSVVEFKAYVEEAVEIAKPFYGEALYARLNWALSTKKMFMNEQTDWSRMKAGFLKITTDHPDPWNFTNFAQFACQAGDTEQFLELSNRIISEGWMSAWPGTQTYFDDCVSYSEMMQSFLKKANND